MTIEVIADIVRAYARNRKTRLLAETMNFLLVLRDGRAVAVLSCSEVQPLLRAADTAAAGYGAEAIALVVESVFPRVELNPMTGRAWERGEAETLRIDANGIEEGWLSEMQIIALALRSGESEEEGWPFTMLGGSVAWSDVPLKISRTGLASALGSRLAGPVIDPATVPDPGASFVGDRVAGPSDDGRGRCLRELRRHPGRVHLRG